VLGVGSRDESAALEGFVTRFDVDGFEHLADLEGEVWEQFGVVSQPGFVFIGDDGNVSPAVVGALGVERLRERLTELVSS